MRFVIEEAEYQEKLIIVTGNTTVGMIKGIWKYKQEPVVGESYHVELSIYCPSECDIKQDKKLYPSVCLSDDMVIFKGVCEDIDEEVYFVRFDVDWLEMIEMKEIGSNYKKGDVMAFSASYYGVEIYPYTL